MRSAFRRESWLIPPFGSDDAHRASSGLLWVLCHEHHRSKRRCGTVREMKEGPSGSAIRSLIPSHRKLLWSKVTVVSVAETPGR